MEKIYLLLRNNQQTGPYSLEELLQTHLKPFDLVWVQGRSAAWQYPGEVPVLKPHVNATPQPESPYQPISTSLMESGKASTGKNVFVSMPRSEKPSQLQTGEEIVPRSTTWTTIEPSTKMQSIPENHRTVNNQELPPRPEKGNATFTGLDAASYPYFNKKTKKAPVHFITAALLLIGITAGYFFIVHSFSKKPQQVAALPSRPQGNLTENSQSATGPVAQDQLRNVNVPVDKAPGQPAVYHEKEKTRIKKPLTVIPSVTSRTKEATEKTPVKGVDEAAVPSVKEPDAEVSAGESPAKKKKLKEVLKGLFSKNDKQQQQAEPIITDDPPPATGRQSTKRTDTPAETRENAAAAPSENLESQVDISSNAPDNWMMGVSGLRITLRNRSNHVLALATVEVMYLDANNQVLDKKQISFVNVPARGKMTLPAPDNKWADHTVQKLVTVQAKEDRYASHQ